MLSYLLTCAILGASIYGFVSLLLWLTVRFERDSNNEYRNN